MDTVINTYYTAYGNAASVLLRTMGGDPGSILATWQERLDNPDPADLALRQMIHIPAMTAEEAAEAAYHDIEREIERIYFASIDRAFAARLVAILGEFGKISIHDSLSPYYGYIFAQTWNRIHPDEEPIRLSANIDQ